MKQIEIKIKTETEETIKVTLPIYLEFAGFNKIVAEDKVIMVESDGIRTGCKMMVECLLGQWKERTNSITKEQFDEAYQKTIKNLQKNVQD